MQQPVAIQDRRNLCNLLGYAEEILKGGERIVSDLAKDAVLAFYEHDVSGLEGRDGTGWRRVLAAGGTAARDGFARAG